MSDKNYQADFGFLTMATPNDYSKAIGLALSLRVSNPNIPIAVACSAKVAPLVDKYFDYVIEEKAGLRGFVHKIYMDEYTPFKETVFFDSDVLVFKPVKPYVHSWGPNSYYACGKYRADGQSSFGLETKRVLFFTGKKMMVDISGAGHAFFRMPEAKKVFVRAREVNADYKNIAGDVTFADEDVINIVMTELDMAPAPYQDFFGRPLAAKFGTLKMDAGKGSCSFVYKDNNITMQPCMLHFAANEAPFIYTWQLFKLFKQFSIPTKGLFKICIEDFYERYIKIYIHRTKIKFLRVLGLNR